MTIGEPQGTPYNTEVNDIAFVVAQMASGLKGALPEQDDFEIAEDLVLVAQRMIDEFYEN